MTVLLRPASGPWPSPRPSGILASQVDANYLPGQSLLCPWGTIVGRWSASGRTWRLSTGDTARERFGLLAFLRVLPCDLVAGALPRSGRSPRGGPWQKKGSGLPRRSITLQPGPWRMWRLAVVLRQGALPRPSPCSNGPGTLPRRAHLRLMVPQSPRLLGDAYALSGRVAEALLLLEQAVEQSAAVAYDVRPCAPWSPG